MSTMVLTDTDFNWIERELLRGEAQSDRRFNYRREIRGDEMIISVRLARALYDLARRAPLPAVDRGQEGAGLLVKE